MKCCTVRTFSSPQFSLQCNGELVRQREDLKVWSSQWIETICRYRVYICCIPSPHMDWSLCSTCAIRQLWHADLICIKSTRKSDIQGKSEALLVFGANPTRTSILKTTKQRMPLCVTKQCHYIGRRTNRRTVYFDQDAPVLPRSLSGQRGRRKRATTMSNTKDHPPLGLFVHNHTNVANPEQLRLATFSRPTFFCRRPSLPRQRAGKLPPTPLFSQLHTDKQPLWSWCFDSNCGQDSQNEKI